MFYFFEDSNKTKLYTSTEVLFCFVIYKKNMYRQKKTNDNHAYDQFISHNNKIEIFFIFFSYLTNDKVELIDVVVQIL